MAMTKKERAELERIEHELALHRALRFPTYDAPESTGLENFADVDSENAVMRYAVNTHTGRVTCHLVSRHGVKHRDDKRNIWVPECGWQANDRYHPMRFFDEEALALEHLRLVKTREFAEALLEIDVRIAATQEG